MRILFPFVQAAAVAAALVAGIAEFAMLQRWRLHAWLHRPQQPRA